MNSHSADQDAIHLDWQRVMQEPSDSEFVALAKVSHRSLYAQGIEKPPAGEKRAGSYIAQLAAGDVRVVSRDRELATSGLMRIGDDLAVLGFIPAGNKSTAVFQLLNKESNTKWAYKQDGPTWNFPGSAIHSSEGYVLSSVETNLTPGPSTLILTLVSEQGATIRQRRYPISIGFVSYAVLIVGKDGVILGSRLFPDVLYRRLSNVIEQSSDHFVAVGSAFGDRGWAIGFTPADSLLHTARPLSNGSAVQTYH
jgi:hypothetical protein